MISALLGYEGQQETQRRTELSFFVFPAVTAGLNGFYFDIK
jgi:hypothetical protein